MWHLSNEYGNNSGECHCEICQVKFREWLKERYKTLDNLNHAWWNSFWSHTYFDWEEIHSPVFNGENTNLGLFLDWQRFTTDTIIDFIDHEVKSVKKYNPEIPCTANLMDFFGRYNYFKLQKSIDVVSWDNYPSWHINTMSVEDVANRSAAAHDLFRSLKPDSSFMLMESSPSSVSWQAADHLKRPGMHLLSCMQSVAHGSDTVQYFQWRKSRGGWEKFHGAVVDHYGEANTRVFADVTSVGKTLESISEIYNSKVNNEVAIIFDWENRWALNKIQGPRNGSDPVMRMIGENALHYLDTVYDHHKAFWRLGVGTDIVDMTCDISKYKVIVAPMLYMFRAGFPDKIREFVKNGGTFVMTYFSGVVDENDLCYLGGMPGEIADVMGIHVEEIDGLYDGQTNTVKQGDKIWTATELCELSHLKGATSLAEYDSDFYKGMPALTVNSYGEGKAYYIAAKLEQDFLNEFYSSIAKEYNVKPAMNVSFPFGVTAHKRSSDEKDYIFLQNYNDYYTEIALDREYTDVFSGEKVSGTITLKAFDIRIFSTDKK
jgi:beta-galactosidase